MSFKTCMLVILIVTVRLVSMSVISVLSQFNTVRRPRPAQSHLYNNNSLDLDDVAKLRPGALAPYSLNS